MTDLFEAAAQRQTPAQLAARALSILIDNGTTITRAMMNATMTSAYGGNDASGRWTQRDSFEVLEHRAGIEPQRRRRRNIHAREHRPVDCADEPPPDPDRP
jgi:hypothetical protein